MRKVHLTGEIASKISGQSSDGLRITYLGNADFDEMFKEIYETLSRRFPHVWFVRFRVADVYPIGDTDDSSTPGIFLGWK